jgi:DNA topoisomerase-3
VSKILRKCFGLKAFRPLQEEICRYLVGGGSALVVMPTGAGKSLCYQLPGLVMPGPVLIISPLIALMEDQVTKLQALKLAAASIHSGRHREEARDSCRRYLAGELKYLFIAPERLGLPGFLQLLAKARPALIAIDEAHCISQWGHDFRGDYRQLGERLACFAGVPIVALTATANEQVQKDIIAQLGLRSCRQFIGGFRRSNLSIEVNAMPSSERFAALAHFLSDPAHRPAIVYVATRKDAELYAKKLHGRFCVGPYHAGMEAEQRSRVQAGFLRDEIAVIVATVAFGMGIDKPNVRAVVHLALPSTMAGYYQEIGRAGRDGEVAKAILLYSLDDQKMLMFLYAKNYPDTAELEAIWRSIPPQGIRNEDLTRGEQDRDYLNGVQKLLVHGGLALTSEQLIIRQEQGWQKSYRQQKKLRGMQLQQMFAFADQHKACRMSEIVRYFADMNDRGENCGLCDICAPETAYFSRAKRDSAGDKVVMAAILHAMEGKSQWSQGALFKLIARAHKVSRSDFDAYISVLIRENRVVGTLASMQKKGHTIHYKRLALVEQGASSSRSPFTPPPLQQSHENLNSWD